ncbi:MAG: 23S rRNA (guanosine(2251)-2'-O)-methyltransferase RlmB, partial [Chloroflexi bacterium]|nr:23S rRNA (guanosine(2251)-2'-O)-methyltransferase RlmB [Chloroflexota bacterium]
MKEWIVGRNPIYEILVAKRRQLFRLVIARGVEEKGRLAEIMTLARQRRLLVEWQARPQLDALGENHQG